MMAPTKARPSARRASPVLRRREKTPGTSVHLRACSRSWTRTRTSLRFIALACKPFGGCTELSGRSSKFAEPRWFAPFRDAGAGQRVKTLRPANRSALTATSTGKHPHPGASTAGSSTPPRGLLRGSPASDRGAAALAGSLSRAGSSSRSRGDASGLRLPRSSGTVRSDHGTRCLSRRR
jgi:hypothetical protein